MKRKSVFFGHGFFYDGGEMVGEFYFGLEFVEFLLRVVSDLFGQLGELVYF